MISCDKCKFFDGEICTDTEEWVDKDTGEDACRYHEDSILKPIAAHQQYREWLEGKMAFIKESIPKCDMPSYIKYLQGEFRIYESVLTKFNELMGE